MKDLFEKGVSFRSYIFNLDEKSKHNLMKYYIPMNIEEEVRERINKIDKKIKVLGVVEPNCPDCWINLSLLEKMISFSGNIDMKLVIRKMVTCELDDYRVDGFIKVPTFIFMDEDFNTLDAFVERPEILKNADINTAEGSKMNMKYIIGKLINETAEEILNKLSKIN